MDEQTSLAEAVERLTKVVSDLERDFYQKRTFWWSFGHGVLYGLGTVIGATILVGLGFYLLTRIPGMGDFLREMIKQAAQVKGINVSP